MANAQVLKTCDLKGLRSSSLLLATDENKNNGSIVAVDGSPVFCVPRRFLGNT